MAEKTTTGRLIAAGGGLLLIISLFLSWYGVSLPAGAESFAATAGVDTSVSGWHSMDFGDIVMFIVGLLAILPAALDIFDLELELPFDYGIAITIGGAISVVWVVWRIIDKPDTGVDLVKIGLKFGIFVALIAAILVVVGGNMQRGEEDDGLVATTGAPPAPGAAAPQPPAAPPQAPPPAAPQPPQQAPPAPQAPPQPPPPQQQPPQPPAPPAPPAV